MSSNRDTERLPVALDAMGGDIGPSVNVEGAVQAVREDGATAILVGDENALNAELDRLGASSLIGKGLSVRHAPEVVLMDDKPAIAVRKKKASSMRVTCDLVKQGEACAALSAGNSGAMMAMALFAIGRIRGVLRPCIAAFLPTGHTNRFGLLVDAGANTDCTPEQLFQFGVMGAAYVEHAWGVDNPVIGVGSNGHEETKGTDVTREARDLLEQTDYSCKGFVEPLEGIRGDVAVFVVDGFLGNMLLKAAEGSAVFMTDAIKGAYKDAGLIGKLGGLLSMGVFNGLKKKFDPREYGAAPLLGLNGPAFIAHGSSDAYTLRRAIGVAQRDAKRAVPEHISEAILATKPILEANDKPKEAAG